jgi:hypothetical protein
MPISNLSIVSKKIIVTRIICIFWLMAKIISSKLWLEDRLFPIVPPLHFLHAPAAIHLILFVFSLATIFSLIIFPSSRLLQLCILIIEVLSCLLDQNRWQPWEYQYIFIILVLFINYKKDENAISSICFILACAYIFSGIGKMNPAFSKNIHDEINLSITTHINNSYLCNFIIFHNGYLLGIIETFLGIGLFFGQTKKFAAVMLIVMHLLIFAFYGPLGKNYDTIIWPWNIAMILILYIFFIRNPSVSIIFHSIKKGWNKVFIIVFSMLPFLNLFGYWDFYLSSSLFSYKTPIMNICIHNKGKSKVLQRFFVDYKNEFLCDSNSKILNITGWAYKEMSVPPYPELRVYENIRSQLLQRYPNMVADFIIDKYVDGKIVRIKLK